MATNEERRSADHLLHEVTIDDLQQLTDLHAQQVTFLFTITLRFKKDIGELFMHTV